MVCVAPSSATCSISLGKLGYDGIGRQMWPRLQAIDVALRSNCSYVHRPLSSTQEHWLTPSVVQSVENFFNIDKDCPKYADTSNDIWNPGDVGGHGADLNFPDLLYAGKYVRPVKSTARSKRWLRERLRLRATSAAAAVLRERNTALWRGYESCASTVEALNVVIHVRYGDIALKNGPVALGRWVPFAYYSTVLPALVATIRSKSGPRSLWVHIMSTNRKAWNQEGALWVSMLESAGASGVQLHVEGNELEAIAHVMNADVFVMANSAFSWLAALYSRAVIFSMGHFNGSGDHYATEGPDDLVPSPMYMLPHPPRCTCHQSDELPQQWVQNNTFWRTSHQKNVTFVHAHSCTLWCPRGDDVGPAARLLASNTSAGKLIETKVLADAFDAQARDKNERGGPSWQTPFEAACRRSGIER